MVRKTMVTLYPGFYLMLACAFMLIPFRWFCAWVIAVAVHELSHIMALKSMRIQIHNISAHWNGVWIHTEPLSGWNAIVSALAGPAGSLLLLIILPILPRTAVCAGFQAVYNLLPIYPLDGGRVLYGVLKQCRGEMMADRICRYVKCVFTVLAAAICCIVCLNGIGLTLAIIAVLFIHIKSKKSLAIDVRNEYNSFN